LSPSAPRSEPRPPGAAAGWQVLLALLSLALSALLWVNGLVDSLERPSVGNALNVRQLQLELLAAPALPDAVRPWLTSGDPAAALAEALQAQVNAEAGPGDPDTLLQLALLEKDRGENATAAGLLQRLEQQVPPEQRPLLRRLEAAGAARPDADLSDPSAPWQPSLSPLTRQLLCADLRGGSCGDPVVQRQAALRLFGVSWLPALLLLLGAA